MLEVRSFVNTPVTSNCYVLFDKNEGKDCIIVDPGSRDEQELFAFIDEKGLSPKYIILTHEHFDHCWGVNQLIDRYHIPIICSQLCAEAIKCEKRNCSVFYDNKEAFTINGETISTESIGNVVAFGNHIFHFYNTPGHTDASISLVVDGFLFTGDTLIKDEKTVTKLPTGSVEKLKETFELYTSLQGNSYCVYPGHSAWFGLDEYNTLKMLGGMVKY